MNELFHAASRAGRRVRQETSIGAAPDAFVAMGVDLVDEALGGLRDRSVLVVGAGQMSSLAIKHLRERGVGPVRIVNRSLEHARLLAERIGAEHDDLEALPDAIANADVVVSATGAAGYVVRHGAVAAAMTGRVERPLVLLDLAVPRDVDPEVAYVDGVRVIDVVTLRDRIGEHDPQTAAAILRARELVADEAHRWVIRRRATSSLP